MRRATEAPRPTPERQRQPFALGISWHVKHVERLDRTEWSFQLLFECRYFACSLLAVVWSVQAWVLRAVVCNFYFLLRQTNISYQTKLGIGSGLRNTFV